MKLGTNTVPVYWSEKGNCKVIKVGVLGDNFGDVQNIETLEIFSTYGYQLMPKVDEIKLHITVCDC